MKKQIAFVIFVVLVFFLSGKVYAISTDMKQTYSPGETAIVKISGNLLEPISPSQIEFKRINVGVPFLYDVKKLGEDYYLWFILPLNESQKNYTLIIRDVATTVGGISKKVDFMQNFSSAGNITDYTIRPGFVMTEEDFTIIIALNGDEDKSIDTDFPTSSSFLLKPGENLFYFSIKNVENTGLLNIKIGYYSLPAYIIKNNSVRRINNSLRVEPSEINSLHLIQNKSADYSFRVINDGVNIVKDIYLDYDDTIFSIKPSKKVTLYPKNWTYYNVSVKSAFTKNISEIIFFKSDQNNISIAVPIKIKFVAKIFNETRINNATNSSLYTCRELLGEQCSSQQTCTGEFILSSDGACCTDKCVLSQESSSKAWIGYLIAAIVIIGLGYLYFKYKKVKPEKNPLQKKINETDKKN